MRKLAEAHQFIERLGLKGDETAAFVLHGQTRPFMFKELQYCVSSNPALPAPLYLLDLHGKGNVYTSLSNDHWLFRSPMAWRLVDSARTRAKNTCEGDYEEEKKVDRALPMTLEFETPDGPGIPDLFDAARKLSTRETPPQPLQQLRGEPIQHKLLRYYMLAAYALVSHCAEKGYKGLGNYVGCLCVDRTGRIFSAGINLGGFKHAETCALIKYFGAHPHESKLPEGTIVFSTLTPCAQCRGYLIDVRPANSVIYFGQFDPGEGGRQGEDISTALDKKLKPVRVRGALGPPPAVVVPQPPLSPAAAQASAESPMLSDAHAIRESVIPIAAGPLLKLAIAGGLEARLPVASAAHKAAHFKDERKKEQQYKPAGAAQLIGFDQGSKELLNAAYRELISKAGKERKGDDALKTKTLEYLRKWLENVRITSNA